MYGGFEVEGVLIISAMEGAFFCECESGLRPHHRGLLLPPVLAHGWVDQRVLLGSEQQVTDRLSPLAML